MHQTGTRGVGWLVAARRRRSFLSVGRSESGVRRNVFLDLEYLGRLLVFIEPEESLELAAVDDMHTLHSNNII
jgi:hypothetical protein